MENCFQTENQNVYQHGLSVWTYASKLIKMLESGSPDSDFRLPNWFMEYRHQLFDALLPLDIIEEYTKYHDVSKPFCRILDENGKQHFPKHAEMSGKIWREAGGDEQVARLMEMDMICHTMKANDIPNFIKNREAITSLIVALAEVHSNSQLFGGIESTSFKIKWKQLNKIGKHICQGLFNNV